MARNLKGENEQVAPLETSAFGIDVAKRVAQAGNEILKVGPLTAKALVDYSRDPKSITHKDVFDRTPKEAAESFWMDRAGQLLGCVYTISVSTGRPARMFHSVVSGTASGEVTRSYRPLGEVLGDANALAQLSIDIYRAAASACDRAESLGLDKSDPAWKRLIAAVRGTVPAAALHAEKGSLKEAPAAKAG